MIDAYCKLFDNPKLDDGDILRRLAYAYDNGITDVIYVPKIHKHTNMQSLQQKLDRYYRVKEKLKLTLVKTKIHLGLELKVLRDFAEFKEELFSNIVSSDFIYINCLRQKQGIDNIAYEFVLDGYCPIITNVEHYKSRNLVKRVTRWKETGANIHINALSLFSLSKTGRNARKLLRNNLVDHVTSSCNGLFSGFTYLKFAKMLVFVLKGRNKTNQIFHENGLSLLKNN